MRTIYWKIIYKNYTYIYTHTTPHLIMCTEFNVSRMKTNICRRFPLLIQGCRFLWLADFLTSYSLERRKSLRSGFAPCPQLQSIYTAVLALFYYEAHKMSLTNQGLYLGRCWILHNIRWTVPYVSW